MKWAAGFLVLAFAQIASAHEYKQILITWTPPTVYESGAAIPPGYIKHFKFWHNANAAENPELIDVLVAPDKTSYAFDVPDNGIDYTTTKICFYGTTVATTLSGVIASSKNSNTICKFALRTDFDDTPPGAPTNTKAGFEI